ncbi:MAG: hypothetical protein HOB37_05960 [Rhodospirillaceae bacterium]|nr:hypothetical protein [Rhodospirillaceae bacterium]MBT7249017.1 hypothetical protein [Rhodospirillaceae bacterium]
MLFPTAIQMTMIVDHGALNAALNKEIEDIRGSTPTGIMVVRCLHHHFQ